MNGNVLVIKSNRIIKPKDYENIYETFVNQKACGVVLLPPGFEAIFVPNDVEIRMETKNDEKLEPLFIDIFNKFCSDYPDFVNDVADWRPYSPPFTEAIIPLSIIIWLKNGEIKRYCYITNKLYPEH